MVTGAILEKGEEIYTRFGKIFKATGNFQKNYNWLITDCEAYPKRPGHGVRITQSEFGKYAWISGEELTDIIRRDDFQWVWGVLSGFRKDVPKEENQNIRSHMLMAIPVSGSRSGPYSIRWQRWNLSRGIRLSR